MHADIRTHFSSLDTNLLSLSLVHSHSCLHTDTNTHFLLCTHQHPHALCLIYAHALTPCLARRGKQWPTVPPRPRCICLIDDCSSVCLQVAAYNTEGKSNPSHVAEFTTSPDRPGCPCRPLIRGRVLPNSFKMAWGKAGSRPSPKLHSEFIMAVFCSLLA